MHYNIAKTQQLGTYVIYIEKLGTEAYTDNSFMNPTVQSFW